ncbi:MAG: hypothetical protein WBX25_18585 [Rhodomicrobium sp.]
MRALLITAGFFFSICAALIIYFAVSDPGQEYDLKLVLPVDTRQMPKPAVPPAVVSRGEEPASDGHAADGRAQANAEPPVPGRPPVFLGDRPNTASEAKGGE